MTEFLQKNVLLIDEKGIYSKNSNSETKHYWDSFVKKVEYKDYYFLYINTQSAIIIPKRIFKNEEHDQFTKLISQHFPISAEFAIQISNRNE